MKKILFFIFIMKLKCFSQAPQWITYNTSNSGLPNNWVRDIAIDSLNIKWMGTAYGGLAKFDGLNWTTFTYSTSILPNNNISCITIDGNQKWIGNGWGETVTRYINNTIWINYDASNTDSVICFNCDPTTDFLRINGDLYVGTLGSGLKKVNGTTWTDLSYNLTMFGGVIYDLEKDAAGNLWIAHWGHGITKFDGTSWINYMKPATNLPSNDMTSIAFESNGTMWATSRYSGLVKYDGTSWTVYTTSNTALPTNLFKKIIIDGNDVKWLLTGDGGTNSGKGLIKLISPTNFTVYDTSNSDIPSNDVISIAIDKFNNKWIGTQNHGVGVFNEAGFLSVKESSTNNLNISCYPNPFTEYINFSSESNKGLDIIIYDIYGRHVEKLNTKNGKATLLRGNLDAGFYTYTVYSNNNVISNGKIIAE
ncbi:MAG: T9SS type A sorting domain-containing protein [Bacteroidia bacterium]|nr:T9SS type A sorting domain-containing protein [Bacteroidia bacterium]